MTGTDLATIDHSTALAIESDQTYWTPAQVATLRQLGLERATEGDLTVFHHVVQRTGLDPFARQIHMIGRNAREQVGGEWQWVTKFTIQTGIDGYRLVARRVTDRLKETLEYEDTLWCGQDGVWTDVWTNQGPPSAAKVTVLRHGKPFPGVALYREFVQMTGGDNPRPTSMWAKMPANQLAKCAEALALRKAFPQDLSGIYTDEEMGQADGPRREAPETPRRGLAQALAHTPETSGPEAEPDDVNPSASEDTSGPEATSESPLLDTNSDLAKAMFATLGEAGITEREGRLRYVSDVLGRTVASSSEMTDDDARKVIDAVKADLEQPFAEGEGSS